MLRNVYLEGELGEKFGKVWSLDASNFRDALAGIECNTEGFRAYLIECHEKDVAFTFDIAGRPITDGEALLMHLNEGDMTISSVPAGAKSGAAKIAAAVVIGFATYGFATSAYFAGLTAAGGTGAAVAGVAVQVGYGIAINLAITGIQQLMAPDPATDSEQDEAYLFDGSTQNIVEGDPVPVLYGELKVPGRPISFEVLNEEFVSLDSVYVTDIYNFSAGWN